MVGEELKQNWTFKGRWAFFCANNSLHGCTVIHYISSCIYYIYFILSRKRIYVLIFFFEQFVRLLLFPVQYAHPIRSRTASHVTQLPGQDGRPQENMLEAPVVLRPGGSALRTAKGRAVSASSVSIRFRSTSAIVTRSKVAALRRRRRDNNNGERRLSS